MKTKFTGKGGYDHQVEHAASVFDPNKKYTITGGSVGESYSYFTFAEVEGSYNTVMFDVTWEQADAAGLMDNPYRDLS